MTEQLLGGVWVAVGDGNETLVPRPAAAERDAVDMGVQIDAVAEGLELTSVYLGSILMVTAITAPP